MKKFSKSPTDVKLKISPEKTNLKDSTFLIQTFLNHINRFVILLLRISAQNNKKFSIILLLENHEATAKARLLQGSEKQTPQSSSIGKSVRLDYCLRAWGGSQLPLPPCMDYRFEFALGSYRQLVEKASEGADRGR